MPLHEARPVEIAHEVDNDPILPLLLDRLAR